MKEIDIPNLIIIICVIGIIALLCQKKKINEGYCSKCSGGSKLSGAIIAQVPHGDNINVYPESKLNSEEKIFYSNSKNNLVLGEEEKLEDYGLKVVKKNNMKPRNCKGSWVEVENKCKNITGPSQNINCGIKKMYTIAPHNMPVNGGKVCKHTNGEVKYSNCDVTCLSGSDCYSEYRR